MSLFCLRSPLHPDPPCPLYWPDKHSAPLFTDGLAFGSETISRTPEFDPDARRSSPPPGRSFQDSRPFLRTPSDLQASGRKSFLVHRTFGPPMRPVMGFHRRPLSL